MGGKERGKREMKKVITDMRSICTYCGHKLTKEETDRLHCPYCKVNLYVLSYPWRHRLIDNKEEK